MTYEVITTTPAKLRIDAQVEYLRVEKEAPESAVLWLRRVFDAIDSLSEMPHRCSRAEEDAFRPYEIRSHRVGQFLLLFTVVEETKTVWVINGRSTWQLPRPQELPAGHDALEDE